ncbi:unnamed protein product [Calypogeia fissa]
MAAAAQALLLAHTAARLSLTQSLTLRSSPSVAASVLSLGKKGRPCSPSSHRLIACKSTAAGGSSSSAGAGRQVEPPNLTQLCEKARLHLTPEEIADFTPKIASVVDWFSQLQDVDVENVVPAVRVGEVEGESTLRADVPSIFEEQEAMLAAAPEREGPYLKVPRILKENTE